MESEKRTAYGEWEPPDKSVSPQDGFDHAIEAALDDATKWGPGEYDVVVQYEARVEITNPGSIGEYRIRLTEI